MSKKKLFVSYSRVDKARVAPLVDALVLDGFDVFWDHDLYAGENWLQRLQDEIDRADAVLVLWSEASVGSDFVRMEAQRAVGQDKLVPARIDAIQEPLGFNLIHSENLIGWSGDRTAEGYAKLIAALRDKTGAAAVRGASPTALAKHKALLRDARLAYGYRDRILRLLDGIETRLEGGANAGRSFAARSFTFELLNLTLLLAVAYPALALLIQFALLGQDATLGGATVIDASETEWWGRAAIGGLVAALAMVVDRLARHERRRVRPARAFASVVAGAVAVVLTGPGAVASIVAIACAVAGTLAFTGGFAGAFAATIAVAFAGAFAGAFSGAVAGSVAVVVFIVAIAGAVAVAGAAILAGQTLKTRAPALALLVVALLALFDWTIASTATLARVPAMAPEGAGAVIVFLALLPIANGLFDFLSIGLTRLLLRFGAGKNWLVSKVFWGVADLAIGAALFMLLGCASIWLIHEMRVGGDGGTTLVDLDALFGEIREDPHAYWWLYLTYFSTLLPTLFHAGAIAAAALDARLSKNLLTPPAGATEAELDRIAVDARAALRISSWLAVPIGLLAVAALLGLFIQLDGGWALLGLFEMFAEQIGALD